MKNNHKVFGIISSLFLLASPALAVPGSDFDFYRADSNPTDFHATTYDNGLTGVDAAAFQQFVNTEAQALDLATINARKLDTNYLNVNQTQEIKVYFIKEEGLYHNQLAITSTGTSSISGLIFNDIACAEDGCWDSQWNFPGFERPSGEDALGLGDYVSLGNIEAGSSLDFQLLVNGAKDSSPTIWNIDPAKNSDSMQHVIAYEYEGYLILGWEDEANGGAAADYNDVVFAIDIGQDNLDCIPTDGEAVDPYCGRVFAD